MYSPRRPFRSETHYVRGLDYHVLRWGHSDAPSLFLLHGWMDCAATFQFLIDALPEAALRFNIIAPDWRGFGRSAWCNGGYWFPDYLADLDALIDLFSSNAPVTLVGHSMGGIVAGLYAGVRPERVAKMVSLEGFGLPATSPDAAPARYARWLNEVAEPSPFKAMSDMADVVARLCRNNPRLDADKAAWLVPHLAIEEGGGVRYRADPKHRNVNPVLYRLEEAKACWRQITAPVLWLAGNQEKVLQWLQESEDDFAARKCCIANLTYTVIPDVGHNLHHDNPNAVAEQLAAFLLG